MDDNFMCELFVREQIRTNGSFVRIRLYTNKGVCERSVRPTNDQVVQIRTTRVIRLCLIENCSCPCSFEDLWTVRSLFVRGGNLLFGKQCLRTPYFLSRWFKKY